MEAKKDEPKKERNEELKERLYPYAATALPKGPDPAWQKAMGQITQTKGILQNFNGQSSYSDPPDCNGTVGPNHYMQTINVTYTIYNKSGTLLAGPTNMNTLFSGVPGASYNDGDPIIMYDEQQGNLITLSSVNDIDANVVSAKTSHFTKFGLATSYLPSLTGLAFLDSALYFVNDNWWFVPLMVVVIFALVIIIRVLRK